MNRALPVTQDLISEPLAALALTPANPAPLPSLPKNSELWRRAPFNQIDWKYQQDLRLRTESPLHE